MSSALHQSRIFAESKDSDGSSSESKSKAGHRPFNIGPYLVEGLIGKGKVGSVFRASHAKLEFPVTLTVLPQRNGEEKSWAIDRMTKFSRDVSRAKNVVHDNVVRPTDIGEEDAVRYVAMEYVDGVSLQTIADRETTLDPEIACEVALQAAVGLRHIHASRLVHRDIRPDNLLLTSNGMIKITDLGMGRLKITEENQMLGPAEYVAPEVLQTGEADPRSDIFSLGCTLYRLLSGKCPFEDTDRTQQPARLSGLVEGLPYELVNAVHRMMALNPAERFQSSNDVVLAMCDWASDESMPDLVAWHMNTQNAGLAPAATFQELERRTARETEKPMAGNTEEPSDNSKETEKTQNTTSLIVGNNGGRSDRFGFNFLMRTALIAVPVLCAVGAFFVIGSRSIDVSRLRSTLEQTWSQFVPAQQVADSPSSNDQPTETRHTAVVTTGSDALATSSAVQRSQKVAAAVAATSARQDQRQDQRQVQRQPSPVQRSRTMAMQQAGTATRVPKRTTQRAAAIDRIAAKPVAVPDTKRAPGKTAGSTQTREVAVRTTPSERRSERRPELVAQAERTRTVSSEPKRTQTPRTKSRPESPSRTTKVRRSTTSKSSPYAGLRSHSYHAKLLKYLDLKHNLQGGNWSLPPSESGVINSAVSYGHTVTPSDIAGYDFTQTVQMQVSGPGGAQWDAGYFVPEVTGIKAGDRMLLAVWLRTVSVKGRPGRSGKISIFSENASTNEKDIYVAVQPSNVWKLYMVPFEASKADLRRVGFHLAFEKQVIEFGGLTLLNYGKSVPFSYLPRKVNGR